MNCYSKNYSPMFFAYLVYILTIPTNLCMLFNFGGPIFT
jgi:hypothetical protein